MSHSVSPCHPDIPSLSSGPIEEQLLQAQEQLKIERQRLADIIEGTKAGTWEWNIQTGEAIFNDRWAEFLGYRLDELAPVSITTWLDLGHPDDLRKSEELLEKHFRGETEYYDCEARMRHKNGEWIWVHDRGKVVSRTEDGKPLWMCGTHHDITERKRMEQEIRDLNANLEQKVEERTAELSASEGKFRSLVETTTDCIWEIDAEGRFSYISPRFRELTGYSPEEFLGKSAAELKSAAEPPPTRGRIASGDAAVSTEYALRHRDGRNVIVEVRAIPYYSPAGEYRGMRGISRDITLRHTTEHELRETRDMLESMLNAVPDLVFRVDEFGTLHDYHSPTTHRLYVEPDRFLGKKFTDVLPEEPARIITAAIAEAAATGSHRGGTYSLEFPDGTKWFELAVAPLHATQQEGRQFIILAHEITVLKNAMAALKQSEQRFRAIADYTYDWEAWVGANGATLWTNPAVFRMTGYTVDEYLAIPEAPLPIVLPEFKRMFVQLYGDVMRGASVNDVEFQIQRKDGSTKWVAASIQPIYDDSGVSLGYRSSVRDISVRKEYELKLEEAREAAEAANRAKSEFLANMSHEIRTPLTSIMGFSQMLEFTVLSGEQEKYLQAIRTSSKSLLSLINDVLDLSKIESGKIELEQSVFSLRKSISDVIKTQKALIHGKGLNLATDIPMTVPDNLTGDQLRLKQILLNLLGNAIKFTEKGSIRVSATVSQRYGAIVLLNIEVTDTGIGMSRETLSKIFDPFVQADSSTTRKYGGTGLGLAICTRLTELMGGRIWAESSEGVGSSFFVRIPFVVNEVVTAESDQKSGVQEAEPWDGPPLRILLVEDQVAILHLVGAMLQKAGHTVIESRNGREALQKWEEQSCDVILMDIHMPVKDGIETTRAIRERERNRGGRIPIIALTARARREERERIMSQGFDGYIAKPFELGQLLRELKRCLTEKTAP